MALTILSQPSELSFSRNPCWFRFQSDNYIPYYGQTATYYLTFNSSIADNVLAGFSLNYTKADQAFTFKTTPDDSGLQLSRSNGLGFLEWNYQLVEDLKANYFLSRDFSIEIDFTGATTRIKLTAKIASPDYDLVIDYLNGLFPATLSLVGTGIIPTKQANFAVFLELFVENDTHTGFDLVQTNIFALPDENGIVNYNISQNLTAALIGLNNDFDRPNFITPVIQFNNKSCRRYYIRYAEAYGSKQTIKKIKESEVKWALLGGVNKASEKDYSIASNFFHSGGYHKFLKQGGLSKNVGKTQPEWLSLVWLNTPPEEVYCRVKTYFTDGTAVEHQGWNFTNCARHDKITIPVGPTQLGLFDLYADKIITHYDIWIDHFEGDATPKLTEIRTYYLDYRIHKSARYFVALSSLGTYDTFFTYGQGSSGYELSTQSAEISRSIDFNFTNGETLDFDTSLEEKETVLTGFVSRRELKSFRDLFLSWDKFQVKRLGFYPVSINTKSIKELKDDDKLYALSFETGYRFSEELWTEDADDTATSPVDLGDFLPIISNPDPVNYDDLYYRKSETHNKAEIVAFINALTAQEAAHHAAQAGLITNLQDALAGKAEVDHDHDDQYVSISDLSTILDTVGGLHEPFAGISSITFEDWQTEYPDFSDVIPKFRILVVDPLDSTKYKPLNCDPDYTIDGGGLVTEVTLNFSPFPVTGFFIIQA
ncbi:MAG: hypothetical protein WBP45_15760 [Daejeonella sp.]